MLKSDSFTVLAVVIVTTVTLGVAGCDRGATADAETKDDAVEAATHKVTKERPAAVADPAKTDSRELVLAGGCFWCMEAAFEQLRGVSDVVSGYAGGSEDDADYRTVSAGLTRHAEAIRITYDQEIIDEQTLLKVFFTAAHDPTQINRQYPDVGRQYRSAVFYDSDEQKRRVEEMIARLNASGQFEKKIATTLEPLKGFYLAEDYHQDYARLNPDQPYVVAHSLPKAARVRAAFPEMIRKE